jgi:hypothetical protein
MPAPMRDHTPRSVGSERLRHRLVAVRVAAQLLPVAGDQQQRVVGARAEHQHRQDERAHVVGGQAGVPGQQVDQRLRGDERDDHADQRQQPQHRAAVGQQQDDDDDRRGDVHQRRVDAHERVAEGGGVAGRAAYERDGAVSAGTVSLGVNRLASSTTRVDSAFLGSEAGASFLSALSSLPASGTATMKTTPHAARTAHFVQRPQES